MEYAISGTNEALALVQSLLAADAANPTEEELRQIMAGLTWNPNVVLMPSTSSVVQSAMSMTQSQLKQWLESAIQVGGSINGWTPLSAAVTDALRRQSQSDALSSDVEQRQTALIVAVVIGGAVALALIIFLIARRRRKGR